MAKKKRVSSKTHTQQQLDDYANQHNPNNKAFQARISNERMAKRSSHKHEATRMVKAQAKLENDCGVLYPLDWMCYSNPYDFD